jgi:hypothetical protein
MGRVRKKIKGSGCKDIIIIVSMNESCNILGMCVFIFLSACARCHIGNLVLPFD